LRGHYPLETDVLAEELGPFAATILIPYFEAGGRYTVGDVHYVAEGDALVPAAETPFARDAAFGYRSSNLRDYIEEKTTAQVDALLTNPELERVEICVADILQPECKAAELMRVVGQTNQSLAAGRDVVVLTSRQLITGQNAAGSLDIGAKVSDALVEVVRRLEVRPRYLIAKGGITSSDLATRGLGVKRARVLGQILPGVPVWELGSETKFPGLPYVVFPGNVGGPEALLDAVQKLNH
jgi:uncharacterized protein YgbK (DUF1537 family)